jgi:hypothetical protein
VEDRYDELVCHQQNAAGAEAASSGGRRPGRPRPARETVAQAGGGQAEGFEEAERDLIEHAEHTAGEGAPRPDGCAGRGASRPYRDADGPRPGAALAGQQAPRAREVGAVVDVEQQSLRLPEAPQRLLVQQLRPQPANRVLERSAAL